MENLKDINGRIIHVGDRVALLFKSYCYRGIERAQLIKATYLGKGQWGHEFKSKQTWSNPVRVKSPECVRI